MSGAGSFFMYFFLAKVVGVSSLRIYPKKLHFLSLFDDIMMRVKFIEINVLIYVILINSDTK